MCVSRLSSLYLVTDAFVLAAEPFVPADGAGRATILRELAIMVLRGGSQIPPYTILTEGLSSHVEHLRGMVSNSDELLGALESAQARAQNLISQTHRAVETLRAAVTAERRVVSDLIAESSDLNRVREGEARAGRSGRNVAGRGR